MASTDEKDQAPDHDSPPSEAGSTPSRKGGLSVGGELRYAFDEGDLMRVEQLLDQGADPDVRVATDPMTLLTYFTDQGSAEGVEILIRYGADVDAVDDSRHMPLFYACRAGRRDIVSMLLDAGADANVVMTSQQLTGLHLAAHIGSGGVARELLSSSSRRKALLHARTESGETALHIAVSRRKKRCASVLLEEGARPTATNKMGHTPLHLAAMVGHHPNSVATHHNFS
eukprot:g5732.t1